MIAEILSYMTINNLIIAGYCILALVLYKGWGFTAGVKREYREKSKRPIVAALIAIFACIIATSIPGALKPSFIVYTYSFACFVYMLACMVSFDGNKLTSVACLLMSFYDLIFSIDTQVNYNAETWIYNNHEIIVILLHSFIILSFSSRFSTRLVSVINYCLGYRHDDSDNSFHTFNVQSRSDQTEVTR